MSEEDEEAMVEKQRKRIEEHKAKAKSSLTDNLLQDNYLFRNAVDKTQIRTSTHLS